MTYIKKRLEYKQIGGLEIYVVIAIFLIGFLAFVIISIRYYRGEVGDYLPKILPENRKEAKKYMLIESLLFALAPEIAMIGMAMMIFTGINIDFKVYAGTLIAYAIVLFLSLGLSGIYREKVQGLIQKEIQKASAA